MEIVFKPYFTVKQPCNLAHSQSVSLRQGETAYIAKILLLKDISFNLVCKRIHPVQYEEGKTCFFTVIHHIFQQGNIGVKPASDILNVIDNDIKPLYYFFRKIFPIFLVETGYRKPCKPVYAIAYNLACRDISPDSVFRCKECLYMVAQPLKHRGIML